MPAGAQHLLRVCADPNNLPFSNNAGEGFENRLAELLARDLQAALEYHWWPQRKSSIALSLDQNECDVLMGVPTALDSVLVTKPYYRSTYVFVSRRDRRLNVTSLSDPRFSDWRIGIHVVGDDYAPPAQALARRGLSGNLVGFSLFGAEGERDPAAKLVDAVAHGDVDVAIAWGPLAGYFAQHETQPLDVVPVSPSMFMAVPFTYEISAAVRKNDRERKAELDNLLTRECAAIQLLLAEYGVPVEKEGQPKCDASQPLRSALSR
ncbi:MAG: quinoprotein dehydrogenase-associated putative ABC transporter substrate-binding protein [Acidobacteriota bacterium]|nr:quinoprotein dehydrogenase-associated putative ABC transporter substrate-binding protein [Acidobacteriota bacterium]